MEAQEPEADPLRSIINQAIEKMPASEKPAPAEASKPEQGKSVAKSDTSPGHGIPDALQGGSEETPATPDPVKLADAMDEIKRAGLEPNAFKGKSEGELLALGVELNTRRRQRDREWQDAQGQSSDAKATGQASRDTSPESTKAKATPEAKSAPLLDLETALTPVFEDLSEEAAQSLKSFLGSLVSQNAALTARLDQEEQARQLAPIEKALDEAVAGQVDLSNPEARAKFEAFAKAKAELDGLSPNAGESAADYIRRVVQNALPANGEQAQYKRRVTETGPEAGRGRVPARKPATLREAIMVAGDKAFNS
jgi:hypothetical protein